MRDSLKVTVKYQFARMLLTQAAASGVAFLFGTVAFWYFTNKDVAKQILSVAFMIVNFAFLYTASKKFAIMDGKPYTKLKVSKLKGALFGVMISCVNILFMAIFKLLWMKFETETGISGIFPTCYNAFFYLWSYPYNGIMNLDRGAFTLYSAAAMIALPVAATLSGYIAGCRKFNITEQLDGFVYEKDD